MKCIYINPPIGDPTCPYCSLYYIKGYVEKKSHHKINIKDCNIEWLDFLIKKNYQKIENEKKHLIDEFEKKDELNSLELIQYLKLKKSCFCVSQDKLIASIEELKNPDTFFDKEKYKNNILTLNKWLHDISAVSFPANYSGLRYNFGIYRCREKIDDIIRPLTTRESLFFSDYLDEELIPYIRKEDPDCIGISIPLKYQVYHAIYIVRYIKKLFPDKKVIAGGTFIHQVYKQTLANGNVDDLKGLFDIFDFCMVGEGEEPTLRLLDAIENKKSLDNIPNVIYRKDHDIKRVDEYFIHDFKDAELPDYSDVKWDLYFSPEKFIAYVPSRGCYWGKCSFCDYGLNDKRATTCWRCRKVDAAVEDLRELSKITKYIYFSVDALSPRWIIELSKKLIDEKIEIFWDAEIRLDYNYTAEDAELMKKGGCLAVSIGMESCNDEVIDRINKGCRPYKNTESLNNLSKAGIAIYPMTFIGFPGERLDQAMCTINFMDEHRDFFAILPSPSLFYLEGSSLVSKNYKEYGIEYKKKFDNLEIANGWLWKAKGMTNDEYLELFKKIAEVCDTENPVVSRPYIGVDTPHSMMYLSRYGNKVLKSFMGRIKKDNDHAVESVFDITGIEKYVNQLLERTKQIYLTGTYPTRDIVYDIISQIDFTSSKKKSVVEDRVFDSVGKFDFWEDNVFSRNIENNRLW